ncbi:histidine phosphatase family protein [Streptomyces sp. WMMC500]|uniref:histidine phosphatase family protein n=1 Tax=Streptomyces sp. WMMC500 TaxID=3015154 RepID=UPI00248CD90F|nr:histidine phosphatase family protein [Streptomyces sp. WMMC500]WBB59661.1 histidine phosphatase family protein [Streptomyces sp. WMMC500]
MTVEIVYETHATTTDNEAGIATGRLPGRLSARGRREARELGERRRGQDIAAVFTSDLHRAVETARLAFPDGRPPIHRDRRLRECDYGDLNGHPARLLAAWRTRHIDTPFPGGQSYRQVLAATDALLRDLARQWNGTRILLIAHTANRWALDCLLTGASLHDLLGEPFAWQAGWYYTLPAGWGAARPGDAPAHPR